MWRDDEGNGHERFGLFAPFWLQKPLKMEPVWVTTAPDGKQELQRTKEEGSPKFAKEFSLKLNTSS